MKQITRFVLALSLMATAGPVNADSFDREDLHAAFMEIAFGVEVQDSDARPGLYVRKFADDVRYKIISTEGRKHAEIADRLAEIDSLIDIDIRPIVNARAANYFVYAYPVAEKKKYNRQIMKNHDYTVSPERPALYDRSNCRFSIFPSRKGTRLSIVFLPIVDEPEWSYCLTEELVQAFGLLNDTANHQHTAMNDRRDSKELTTFDTYLLKMLYDDRIRPGIMAEDVRQLLNSEFPIEDTALPFTQPSLDICSGKLANLTCVADD
jgi:hypothetical protein